MSQEFYRIKRLPPYVIAEVNALRHAARQSGRDIIDLGMGNPDLPPPQHVIDKLCEVARRPDAHGYSQSKGIPGLRRAQANYYERRFGVSFEQLAHRLTTLQRIGQRGLPFFMVRIDRAGQFSKTFTGASTARFIESGSSCPLWDAHRAFDRAGELQVQFVALDNAGDRDGGWLTMARTVEGSGAPGKAQFVIVLGVEAVFAQELAQARGVPLRSDDAQPIGPGCARCHRSRCSQRSLPPIGRKLAFDKVRTGITPFEFAPD